MSCVLTPPTRVDCRLTAPTRVDCRLTPPIRADVTRWMLTQAPIRNPVPAIVADPYTVTLLDGFGQVCPAAPAIVYLNGVSVGNFTRVGAVLTFAAWDHSRTNATLRTVDATHLQLLRADGTDATSIPSPGSVTLTRTGWQGAVVLSQAPRTNWAPKSEPLLTDITVASGGLTQAHFTDGALSNGVHFPSGATLEVARARCPSVSAGQSMAVSVFVRMDDGSAPQVTGNVATGDFCLYTATGVQASSPTVTPTGVSGLYKVTWSGQPVATGTDFGVIRYAAQSGKGFSVTGWHLCTTALTLGSYIKTAGVATTLTDYTASSTGGITLATTGGTYAASYTYSGGFEIGDLVAVAW